MSFLAISMALVANATVVNNFTGTYNNCDIKVDYAPQAILPSGNPVTVQSAINLKASTTTLGKYSLGINDFNFLGQQLSILVDNLTASEFGNGVSFTAESEYIQGPNAEVGGNQVTTVLKITSCSVENSILNVQLVVYIGGEMPFDHAAWLTGLDVADDDEAYDEGGIVNVSADSKNASNYVSDATPVVNNFTGTYNNCDIVVDYAPQAILPSGNPVTVQSAVDLKTSNTTAGKYSLGINDFNFLGQQLSILVDNLTASKSGNAVSFTAESEYIQGPNAEVGGNQVTTVLKITSCSVENSILDVKLVVYIGGTMPFDHTAWLAGLDVADDDEAYDEGFTVNVSVNSKNASNYVSDLTGIFAPKAETLNIYPTVATSEINVENAEGKAYSIINLNGAVVANGTVANEKVNVNNLANGNYIIAVGNAAAKFIKK